MEGELHLSRLFAEGMVLQRSNRTRIWGWCRQGEKAEARLYKDNRVVAYGSGIADESGYWEVFLDISKAGYGYVLEIETVDGNIQTIRDVSVGEVWLCSGQSNMELPVARIADRFPEEVADCEDDQLRIFKISEHYEFQKPLEEPLSGEWKKSTKENVMEFSGLTWFYGRFLREAVNTPVGLINVSLGGSPIEAWMGKDSLKEEEDLQEIIRLYASDGVIEQKQRQDEEAAEQWSRKLAKADQGIAEKWYQRESREKNPEGEKEWKKIILPGWLEEQGIRDFKGVIWLKKVFDVPEEMAGAMAKLWLGTLVDSDETYVNGRLVGSTAYQYPPRKYEIAEGILKKGKNEVMIRLTCNDGNGRVTPDKPYKIFTSKQSLTLDGEWKCRIGAAVEEPAPAADFVSWKPSGLYNGMLAPCRRYTIKGFVWYQGESNDKAPQSYEMRLKKLILDWRKEWEQADIPFLVAQLPGFAIDLPTESGWPLLREAQRRSMELPNVAMTVNLDLGEWNDLHPLNKKGVAYRLSLAARALAYGEDIQWQGPVPASCEEEKEHLRIFFSGTGAKLLTVDGKEPQEFEASGEDGKFYPVEARIEGNTVLLVNHSSQKLIYVRYAWKNCPDRGLLCNEEGLLASPFFMRRGA